MRKGPCIVNLEHGVWIAPWTGDPGRTLVRSNAQRFTTEAEANTALADARQYREFKHAKVESP